MAERSTFHVNIHCRPDEVIDRLDASDLPDQFKTILDTAAHSLTPHVPGSEYSVLISCSGDLYGPVMSDLLISVRASAPLA